MHALKGGCRLEFLHRGSWKARLHHRDGRSEVVPVTWTADWKPHSGKDWFELAIWVDDDPDELAEIAARREPFLVAVAEPKDDTVPRTWDFKRFVAVLEVVATGERVKRHGLQTRVLRRVYG